MKFVAFIFILLPVAGNLYVCWRTWQMLPLPAVMKWVVMALMMMALACLFVQFIVGPEKMPLPLTTFLYSVGTSWLFIELYLVLIFIILDILQLVHVLPKGLDNGSIVGSLTVALLMIAIFIYGNIHYNNKVRVPIALTTDKPLAHPLRMVMISDMHLGFHNDVKELHRWIDIINAEHPDILLIAGDIIDVSVRPLIEENMAAEFRRLKCPVYACLGNHDYYSHEPRAAQFMRDAGITLLRDSGAVVDNELLIMGRDDRTNAGRKSVDELMKNAPRNVYSILLDHQPYNLEQAEKAHVDFQFSGHTHHGQVFPLNLITDAVYECAYGPLQKGSTRYYVSSGLGIWGGKFRIGTQSEYIVAELKSTAKTMPNNDKKTEK
jgi:predicted MPP superfamily phosphohydrolase